jgi:acetylglutamate kinase
VRFVGGRRVTSARDVELVRMALSGSANKRLVASLVGAGVRAVGLSGEDGPLLAAAPLDAEQLGHVGAPRRVDAGLLRLLLDAGYLPVVSPVSRNAEVGVAGTGTANGIASDTASDTANGDPNGHSNGASLGAALNVNGDDAAAAIAAALEATELVLVSDVPGVLADGELLPALDADAARRLVADGTAAGGMHAKLQAALATLEGGVARVRIGDLAAIADEGRGTVLCRVPRPESKVLESREQCTSPQ